MIPLRDSTRSRTYPVVTLALIAANLGVFAYELTLTRGELARMVYRFGLVPARLGSFLGLTAAGPEVGPAVLFTLVTSVFIHGGWVHVLGNMLYLWIFGDNVEDRLGRPTYLIFYLLAGVAGNLAHAAANPTSPVPTVGASGAVAGVLGAYFIAFPRARVLALVPLGWFLQVATVPAVVFLFLWFLLQLVSGVASLGVSTAKGVAWWAHIGGFATGAAWFWLWRRRR
ncbi:MAG: rhomboid family intramembrane serine protease [Acetobacteraceae bacterium]|nr:rhomboid family intramembrane serine protease [Acetobacteraceae bacterium]